jgi:hypothetical protein
MKIIATKIKAKDLKVGDLFSTAGQDYWNLRSSSVVGERVYIRTETPTSKDQEDEEIYKIEIKKEE